MEIDPWDLNLKTLGLKPKEEGTNKIKYNILKTTTGNLNKQTNDVINDEKFKSTILERIANSYGHKLAHIDIKFLLKNHWDNVEIDTFLNIIKNLKKKKYNDINITDIKKYIKSLINLPETSIYIKEINNQYLLQYERTVMWLNRWLSISSKRKLHDIPSYIEKYCVRQNYNELFRGISWDLRNNTYVPDYNISQFIETDYNKYSINDYINVKSQIFTSWTKSLYIAETFADRKNYGIIIKLSNIHRKNVLCDISETITPKQLAGAYEEEVILYPNSFRCQIVGIFYNGTSLKSIKEIDLDRIATI
jgi:hypothetical protein